MLVSVAKCLCCFLLLTTIAGSTPPPPPLPAVILVSPKHEDKFLIPLSSSKYELRVAVYEADAFENEYSICLEINVMNWDGPKSPYCFNTRQETLMSHVPAGSYQASLYLVKDGVEVPDSRKVSYFSVAQQEALEAGGEESSAIFVPTYEYQKVNYLRRVAYYVFTNMKFKPILQLTIYTNTLCTT
jgi:hypothetical protein